MKKENKKYYTPEIKEFHVGFEVETQIPTLTGFHNEIDHWEWKKWKIDEYNMKELMPFTLKALTENYRVKYLDREDIEECGFKQEGKYNFKLDNCNLFMMPEHTIIITREFKPSEVIKLFAGIIKNKSEFKKLLQQLQIEKIR